MILMIVNSLPLLLKGLTMTLLLWITAAVVSLSIGMCFGVLCFSRLRVIFLSKIISAITFVLRGVPYYVQLLVAYFVLPDLLGVNWPAFIVASVSLGMCSAAYVSQIIRGGLNSIPSGQWDVASVLGYSKLQTLRFVIFPQLMRCISPSLVGEMDQLLKSTSIISSIGVLELTRAAMNIIAREMNPLPIYLAISVMYLVISSGLNFIGRMIERRFASW